MKKSLIALFFLLMLNMYAQPSTITYQGVLSDDQGDPITATESIRFDIFSVVTGGSSLWNETHGTVSVSDGLFNVELGSVTPFGSLDFSQELWLELTVSGTTLSPRIPFNASSYAMFGEVASNLDGGAAGSIPYQTAANTTAMLAIGSDDQVLTLSSGLPVWADAYSGLTNWSESTTGDGTVSYSSVFTPNSAQTNVDAAITPKGTGALVAQPSASGSINNRGENAVDLQLLRMGATQVAGGDYSVISGGLANLASGDLTTVVGGGSNSATGDLSAVLGGGNNNASGESSLVGGLNNTAASYGETVLGYYATTYTPNSTDMHDATDRLFVIGNGLAGSTRNALTILKNATTIIGDNGYDGILQLYSEQGATDYSVQFQPHATMTEAVTYTLPADNGDADQVLTTDGSGNLSWEDASGGGSGVTKFGYVYQLATVLNATVVGGADVPFSNNGPLSSVTHTAGTTTITVPTTGTYKVDYSVNITAGVGASLAVAVNGTVDASTNIPFLVATGNLSGSVMLTLTAGDVLTLRNNSAVAFTTALSPSVGAQFDVFFMN